MEQLEWTRQKHKQLQNEKSIKLESETITIKKRSKSFSSAQDFVLEWEKREKKDFSRKFQDLPRLTTEINIPFLHSSGLKEENGIELRNLTFFNHKMEICQTINQSTRVRREKKLKFLGNSLEHFARKGYQFAPALAPSCTHKVCSQREKFMFTTEKKRAKKSLSEIPHQRKGENMSKWKSFVISRHRHDEIFHIFHRRRRRPFVAFRGFFLGLLKRTTNASEATKTQTQWRLSVLARVGELNSAFMISLATQRWQVGKKNIFCSTKLEPRFCWNGNGMIMSEAYKNPIFLLFHHISPRFSQAFPLLGVCMCVIKTSEPTFEPKKIPNFFFMSLI